MSSALFAIAVGMLRGRSARRRLVADDIKGTVTTAFRFVCLGSFTGILFQAEVLTNLDRGRVAYLVHPKTVNLEPEEIAEGEWVDITENFERAEAAQWN